MANVVVTGTGGKSPLTSEPARLPVRLILGWTISILCLALVVWKLDVAAFLTALRHFTWPLLLPALAGLAFGYSMRIVRWAYMLRATGSNVSGMACAAPFLGSIALNNVLPLRAGDIVRATVFPAAIGVPRTAAISSIIIERLLDLLTLTLFLAIGATALGGETLPAWLVNSAIGLAATGGVILFCVFAFSGPLADLCARWSTEWASGLTARLLSIAATLLDGFRFMSAPKALAPVLLLSILTWLGEASVFYFVLLGFGADATPVTAMLVMSFVTISTLVPSSPGYVGPFHVAAITIGMLIAMTRDAATSFAVVSHLMLWAPTTIAGALAMLSNPELFLRARRISKETATDAE